MQTGTKNRLAYGQKSIHKNFYRQTRLQADELLNSFIYKKTESNKTAVEKIAEHILYSTTFKSIAIEKTRRR
jgi:hypothetical protein